MTSSGKIILGALAMLLYPAIRTEAQLFAPSSLLAEGKWTKVTVQQTGLYEISYDTLREMGFDNPSLVRVFGNGGKQFSEDLKNIQGVQIYSDDLQPVPVAHSNDRIYFYGKGLDNIIYSANDGYFLNGGLNIYSDKGFYFLTDSQPGADITCTPIDEDLAGARSLDSGWWYTYHETDLLQGDHHNGQLFWGEDFSLHGVGRMEWSNEMKDPILNKSGVMVLDFYKGAQAELTLKYGITDGTGGANKKLTATPNLSYYEPAKPRYAVVTPKKADSSIYVEIVGDRPDDTARLDYWIFSYRRQVPTLSGGLNQDAILFEGAGNGSLCTVRIPSGESRRVFDITDATNVTEYPIMESEGETMITFRPASDNPTLLVFDPTQPQLQIEGYESVDNQNLHARAAQGADLAIICTPEMRPYAELHADMHRRLQGLEVIVADCRELYNEFSSGHPDPIAYRAFAAMLAENPIRPLKNILMYGPATGDIRTNSKNGNPYSRLILVHNRKNKVAFDHGASTIFDFYGITTPYISSYSFEALKTNLGVGYLTVENETDAMIALQKVEDYLNDDSHAYYLNRFFAMGCDGDNHTHEQQALSCIETFDNSAAGASVSYPLLVDNQGITNSTEQFFSILNDGVNLMQYLGHGDLQALTHNRVFTGGMINQLRNHHLPVMIIAGCDLTLPDMQMRGIGERIVLDTRNGAIGCVTTNRQAWSGPNFEFSTELLKKWGWDNGPDNDNVDRKPLTEYQTLGEWYAAGKTMIKNSNELAYMLIGDPAIPLVGIQRKVAAQVTTNGAPGIVAGHKAVVTGQINHHSGELDTDFNGEIVLSLMEPAVTLDSKDFITAVGTSLPVKYENVYAAQIPARVKDGKFSVELPVPPYMARFDEQCRIIAAAYDKERRLGSAGALEVLPQSSDQAGIDAPAADNQPPVISKFEYDAASHALLLEVSDDNAIIASNSYIHPNTLSLLIDGENIGANEKAKIALTDIEGLYSLKLALPNLNMGTHTARVSVSDLVDNVSTAETTFNINPAWAQLELETLQGGVADGSITFVVSGAIDNRLKLHILDSKDNEVYSAEHGDTDFEWDCKDNNGAKVAPGIYKAFVRESGRPGHRAHSATIRIAVI